MTIPSPSGPPSAQPTGGRKRITVGLIGVLVVVLAGAGIFLAARVGEEPAATPTPSGSPTPSPSPSLPADQQQAVDEASAVILAYEQMYYDLLAATDPYLNDLNTVATNPQLDIDLQNIQQQRAAGNYTVESTGPVVLGPVDPVEFALDAAAPSVTLLVCVDSTAAHGTDAGQPWTGPREQAQYRVEKTTYLPAPGWAVAKVLPPAGHDQPQPC